MPTERPPRRSPIVIGFAVLVVSAGGALFAMTRGSSPLPTAPPDLAAAPLPFPGDPVNEEWAALGRRIYEQRCAACHAIGGGRMVGPDLAGVTERRGARWVRAMILSPDSMLESDSVARALLDEYQIPMIDPRIGAPRARAVIEYLRSVDPGRSAVGPNAGDEPMTPEKR